jgi:signal transduction histidine kinase
MFTRRGEDAGGAKAEACDTAFTRGNGEKMINDMSSVFDGVGKRDIAIAVGVSLLGLLLMWGNVTDPEAGDVSPLAIPVFLLVTLPLIWRRTAPIAALVAVSVGLLIHLALFGTDVVRCGVVVPTAMLLGFAAGSQLDGRDAKLGLFLSFVPIGIEGAYFFGLFALVFMAVDAGLWYVGKVVRSRSRMAQELEVKTRELREARDTRALLEVATDRARLSGELDELLQRRLGDLASLADEGARERDPAAATATLVDIEQESRQTLEEMRAIVGVLREDDADAQREPQPTLTHLEAMLVRAKGADAHLSVEGNPRVLPPGVELSAYRVVEHLLDAMRDAREVDVHVRFADDALELSVAGPGTRPSKAAIERARERVALHHGSLRATSRGGRAEAVASIPVLARA